MLKKYPIRRNVRYQVPCTGTVPPNSTAKVSSETLEAAFLGDLVHVLAKDQDGNEVREGVFLGVMPGTIKCGEKLFVDVINETDKVLNVVVTVIGWSPVSVV